MLFYIALALVFVLSPFTFFDLTPVAHAAFLDIGMGPRALGMGDAFTGLADDYLASYYNPAGLALIPEREIGSSYAFLYPGLDYPSGKTSTGDGFVSYAHPLEKNIGTMGFSWVNRHISDLYAENSYIFSYGYKVTERIFLGGSFKLLQLNYSKSQWGYDPSFNWSEGVEDPIFANGTSVFGAGLDIGVLIKISRNLRIGMCLKDFNQPDMHLQNSNPAKNTNNYVPMSIRIGADYEAGAYRIVADLISHDYDYFLNSGVELDKLTELPIKLRAGFGFGNREYCRITAGASYLFRPDLSPVEYQMDYAFLYPLNGLAGTLGSHRIGITLRFIPPQAPAPPPSPPAEPVAAYLKFLTEPFRANAGEISPLIIITAKDTNGQVVRSFSETARVSSSSVSGGFSLVSGPWSGTDAIKFSEGTASFYYRDVKAGEPVIKVVSQPGGLSASQTLEIKPVAARVKFLTSPFIINTGESSPMMIVAVEDSEGDIDKGYCGTASLFTSSGTGEFSLLAEFWSKTDTARFSEGAAGFYYRDMKSGNPLIKVSCPGLEPAVQDVRIKPREIMIVEIEKELTRTALGDVLFEFGKADLSVEAINVLDKVVSILKDYPKSKISVEGHTDSKGSQKYNINLSQRRADSVARYFIEKGIPGDHIAAIGYGEDAPVAPNNTDEGRAKNRRVEIVIVK